MTVRIGTWNVNSIRMRVSHLARVLEEKRPDILCLQELKASEELFPHNELNELGYPHVVVRGQKAYNGVAILSRRPLKDARGSIWCGIDDKRHVSATLENGLEVHNFYVPAGGAMPDVAENPKFRHKLDFLTEMRHWAATHETARRDLVIVGDLNVAPLENDVWNHKRLKRSVGHTPVESEHMIRLQEAGEFVDVGRHFVPAAEPLYSWWGYRYPQAFEKDYGWRLDHVWASPTLTSGLRSYCTFKDARAWERPSDHVPVFVDIA